MMHLCFKLERNISNKRLFVFGDSIVDAGNNNNLETLARSNFPPYGRNFKGVIPTGRFSDGKVLSDLIAEELGISKLSPTYLDLTQQIKYFYAGANFASGGSGYDPKTPKIMMVLPMSYQLKLFKEYMVKLRGIVGEENAESIIRNSIYLVSAGNNDIGITYFLHRRSQFDLPSYVAFVVAQASTLIKGLYKLGARRVVVTSTQVLGCSPAARTIAGGIRRDCVELLNQAALLFNSNLSSQLHSLHTILPHANISFLDLYTPLLHLIQNPQPYGFSVVDRGCCGRGTLEVGVLCNISAPGTCTDTSKYIFWDSLHLTQKAYQIIVSNIFHRLITKLI